MKKIKKLFKLIPVFCVAFVSGLSAVLSHDHELKPVNADSTSAPLYVESFSTNLTLNSQTSPNYSVSFRANGTIGYYFRIDSSGTTYFLTLDINIDNLNHPLYGYCSLVSSPIFTCDVPSNASNFKVSFSYLRATAKSNNIFDCQVQFLISIDNGGFLPLRYLGLLYAPYSFRQLSSQPTGYQYMSAYSGSEDGALIADFTYQRDIDDGAFMEGYNQGYLDGYNAGYSSGQSNGQANGYREGFSDGASSREQDITNAYNEGYNAGYDNGLSVDDTAATIFSGILQVGLVPINFFLAIFNFEILGINLSAFVSALLTVCLTVIVIKTITGKNGGD